jgi:uncharacterized iron-regulated membrane protein
MHKSKEYPHQAADSLLAQRRSLFWRIHFWAALIASPFALLAALSGILYVFTPQIESALYGGLDQVTAIGPRHTLDEAVAAGAAAAPAGLRLQSVQPPVDARDSVKLTYAAADQASEHAGHAAMVLKRPTFGQSAAATVVYVDPYTLRVLGSMQSQDRFNMWAKRLHSRLLQGDGWRWMIELAASWMMVMLLTGVYLWWPRGAQRGLPQAGARGRNAWRQWHAFLGVALGVMSLVILTTGLTWSKQAGGQIRVLRDWSGQGPAPAPGHLMSMPADGMTQLGWQAVWDVARAQTPTVAMQLTPPAGEHGVWRALAVDRSQPASRFDLVLDAYRGQRLHYADWNDETAFGKATAVGIPFHRGEFGWWNQALLLLFGVGVLFSLVSGWVMFFKRRKPGAPWLPRLSPGAWRSASPLMWISALLLCAVMPLLTISAAAVALLEAMIAHRAGRA